jgi:hypothetical protein
METYATFEKGDKVRARMNTAFSLTEGQTYTVFKALKQNREAYAYVYYVSDAKGNLFCVKNAHIVLEAI